MGDNIVLRFQCKGQDIDVVVNDIDKVNLIDLIIEYWDTCERDQMPTPKYPKFTYLHRMNHLTVASDLDLMKMFDSLKGKDLIYLWVDECEKPTAVVNAALSLRQTQSESAPIAPKPSHHSSKVQKLVPRRSTRKPEVIIETPHFEVERPEVIIETHEQFIDSKHGISGISGIPCKHGMRAIMYSGLDPLTFVDPWYSVQKYKAAYGEGIKPIPDRDQWGPTEAPDIAPPTMKRGVGRPVKNRKRGEEEQRKGKRSKTLKCGNCGEHGHNRVTCKGAPTQKERLSQSKAKGKQGASSTSKKAGGDTGGNKKGGGKAATKKNEKNKK